jgi:response regulator RpfG family c-di-GMP phosphodiesterase
MPGIDGVEVCRRIRASDRSGETYIILLTSMNRREDVVFGLESGADDYIVKPFHRQELRARVACGERVVTLQASLRERVRELEAAAQHIQTLQGILPICMFCKKIRNDEDAWEKVETYIQNHSDAKFSHGLCPHCFEEHYGEDEAA